MTNAPLLLKFRIKYSRIDKNEKSKERRDRKMAEQRLTKMAKAGG
jgi:hypothetical protein